MNNNGIYFNIETTASCNDGSYCKRFFQHCKVALLPEYPITLFPIEIS